MIRSFSARVDVLRGGVRYRSLPFPAAKPPNIYADADAAIKTSLAGSFVPCDGVDLLTDELQPVLILDGVESPLGVFVVSSVIVRRDAATCYWQVEAFDRGLRLQRAKTEGILHLDAGTNYIEAVKSLLAGAGVAIVIATPTAYALGTDREDWAAGTDYLTIVNALLAEINYAPIWFDARGAAILRPYTAPSAAGILHRYDNRTPVSGLQPGMTAESDLYNNPNVFVGIVSNPDLPAPLTATAVNDDPSSPLSTVRRGMRIPQVYQVDNIADQAALQAHVDKLALRSRMVAETLSFQTLAEPGHGIGDVLALNCRGAQGIYEEVAWYLTLAPGKSMTHDCRKVLIV